MHNIVVLATLLAVATALPQRNNRSGRQGGAQAQRQQQQQQQQVTAFQQAAQVPQGVSQAQDGSTILDDTVMVNNLPIRFKISAPAEQFLTTSGVPGATATFANGTMGANVLLHGDGGQSFFDFPNQNVQANTMGVALLAPDSNLFWGGGAGLDRTDGVAHAQAVSDFITTEMPKIVAMNMSAVVFTGVSGGSLLMSGFFIPAQMQNFANSAVELNCGALPPQVQFKNAAAVMSQTKIHYQSTQQELALLQDAIPQAIVAYEQLAASAGLSAAQVNQLQTVDNTPTGGHCEFDGKDFVSGVQTMLTSYSNVMQGGNGAVAGIGAPSNGVVTTGVVGNENVQFVAARKRQTTVESMLQMRWAQVEIAEEPDIQLLACDRASCRNKERA